MMADIFTSFRLLKHQINKEKKWVFITELCHARKGNGYENADPCNFIMVGD